jgi:glycosyltransferase involved in cell wall biosynthesis
MPPRNPSPAAQAVTPATAPLRVLVIAHNHPKLFPGGAEILAYGLFQDLDARAEVEAFFLGATSRVSHSAHVGTAFQTLGDTANEMLFWGDAFDYFYQSQRERSALFTDFRELLQELQPDIVHLHHTLRIGVEVLTLIRQTLPDTQIVYTLHDYIPICYRDGQMVKAGTELGSRDSLCEYASPARCHQCFPEIAPQQFKLREQFLKTHFSVVDRFVSPSQFLIDRYHAWGIAPERMSLIPNGIPSHSTTPHRPLPRGEKRNRIAFFGQVSPFKGTRLLLAAAERLMTSGFSEFHLDIYGNIGLQNQEFKDTFTTELKAVERTVSFHGTYENRELPQLMRDADWVVAPSVWWENAPLVIQEAFLHKRPVICSDIGGMAEMVTHERTGLHFRVGSVQALAETIKRASTDNDLWNRLVSHITPPPSLAQCNGAYLALYRDLQQQHHARMAVAA